MDSIWPRMLGQQGIGYAHDVGVLYMFLLCVRVVFSDLIVFLTCHFIWKFRRL